MKIKCKHILLSYEEAENSSHDRPLEVAVADANKIIAELRKGVVTWNDAAVKHSACLSHKVGGDLGWFEEETMHPDFANAVKCIPINELSEPPITTPWGIHIVLRTG